MNVTVNGKPLTLADGATIADLAAELHLGTTGVALARNNRVVPRTEWHAPLADGDTVVVINASCGG